MFRPCPLTQGGARSPGAARGVSAAPPAPWRCPLVLRGAQGFRFLTMTPQAQGSVHRSALP